MAMRFETICKVATIEKSRGLVFGWALTSDFEGEPYFDDQGDNVDPEGTLDAALAFAKSLRVSTDLHARDEAGDPIADGTVPFLMPVTKDIAKAFNLDTGETYGLMIGMQPSPSVFKKYESGEYKAFSIGGRRIEEEVVEL